MHTYVLDISSDVDSFIIHVNQLMVNRLLLRIRLP